LETHENILKAYCVHFELATIMKIDGFYEIYINLGHESNTKRFFLPGIIFALG